MNTMSVLALCALIICASIMPSDASVRGWFAPSTLKVMQNQKPARSQQWTIYSARNEVEACQLILTSDRAVSGVDVTASKLHHTRGKGELKAELFRVAYIPKVDKKSSMPDPLPPLTSLDLAPNQAQPVWISVRVPKDAAPGNYAGTVKVKAGSDVAEYPITVKVWDFALPDTPSCVTAFGINSEWIAPQHGVKPDSVKMKELHRKYYEMLLDHRISAFYLPVDLMSNEAPKYLEDPRMTSYAIPYLDKDEDLKKVMKHLVDGGWFRKSYFYALDEPNSPGAYKKLDEIIARLRSIEPNFRIVLPFFCNPDYDPKLKSYDLMEGKVNVWCPESCLWDDVNIWNQAKGKDDTLGPLMEARRKAGDDIWWYVCCGPGDPYSNFFVDMKGMQHRMLFWQQKMKDVQGLLYWSTTWWNPDTGTPDPWKSITTFTTINPNMYGDGSLFYPGKQVGVDGPVSSIRMEIIRDGIEDFDYLALADERLGPEKTREYVGKLVKSLTEYSTDPMKLEAVRKELGSELEKATAAARKQL